MLNIMNTQSRKTKVENKWLWSKWVLAITILVLMFFTLIVLIPTMLLILMLKTSMQAMLAVLGGIFFGVLLLISWLVRLVHLASEKSKEKAKRTQKHKPSPQKNQYVVVSDLDRHPSLTRRQDRAA